MFSKIIISVFVFFLLALFQTSFLAHFIFLGIVLNLVLSVVILLNLFEETEKKSGFIYAFIGGLFLEVFSLSGNIFGVYVIVCLLTAAFIKLVLKRYVQIPTIKGI